MITAGTTKRTRVRGQVTIWIVLGVLLMILIAITGYFVTISITSPLRSGDAPVQDYVNTCIENTARRGLELIGQQGGYLDPLDATLAGRPLRIDVSAAEGDVLFINDDIMIPYWWHMSTANTCTQCTLERSNIPSQNEIERQLAYYIENNIAQCTDGFSALVSQGYLIKSADARASVDITEENIFVELAWPLTIEDPRGRSIALDEFATTLEIPLLKLLRLAQDLSDSLIEQQTMEHIVQHLIASFSAVDYAKLPPMAAVEHSSNIVTWQDFLVEENLKRIFSAYFPLVQVSQSTGAQRIEIGEGPEQGVYDALFLDLLDYETTYGIEFKYLDWPIYFDISPTVDGTARPEIHRSRFPQDLAPPFQTNYYEFFYDISAPYLITLTAPTALKGEGYQFTFAMEANIRDNKNMKEWNLGRGTVGPWDDHRYSLTKSITIVELGECTCNPGDGFTSDVSRCFDKINTCSQSGNIYKNYSACAQDCVRGIDEPPTAIENAQDIFCDETFKQSGLTTFRISDAQTNKTIENAEVHYGCGNLASCSLGMSDRRGIVRDTLPYCFNGFAKTYLEGYYTDTQLHTPDEHTASLNISLVPLHEVRVVTPVYELYNASNRSQIRQSQLGPRESIVLSVEKILEHPYETPFVKFVTLDSTQTSTLELIPGQYALRAQLIDEVGYVIPRSCKVVPIKDNPPVFIPDEDIIIRPGIRGGIIWDEHTQTIAIDADDLYQSNELNLPVLRQPAPNCVDAENCVLPNCVGLDELDKTAEMTLLHQSVLAVRLE